MSRFEFKLPDIGEGIAEAEIVAWHVKVGDTIAEDQQIADMMTDKATVEMESPVAGKVLELAGEVGDQVPIGSVLAVIETEGADRAAEPVADSEDERPLADGAVEATPELAEELPVTSSTPLPLAGGEEERSSEGDALSSKPRAKETSPPPAPPASGRGGEWVS
jgi:2-oxoisovalerate dehydrogenase E2 component (dihydrolipoyl transacylase)